MPDGPPRSDLPVAGGGGEGRLDRIDGRLGAVETKLAEVDGKLSVITVQIASLDNRLGQLDNRLGQLINKLPSWWQMPAVIGSTVALLILLYSVAQYLRAAGRL